MRPLILLLLCFLAFSSRAQLTYKELSVEYDSAIEYKNLKIIPITRKDIAGSPAPNIMSLSKAIQKGYAVISERGTASTENVHWLRINNKSNIPILISSGEIIMGGRQDRMVSKDTVLTPVNGADQYISVMCVEEDRWSDKEKKFAYLSYANLRLRKVVDQSKNQVLIWNEIFAQLDSAKIKSPTLAYAGQRFDKKANLTHQEYMNYFMEHIKRKDSTWVGFVCVSGNKILGTDIYAGENLFYDQMEPLLQGYVEDAVNIGSPVQITDETVKKYMNKILKDEKSQQEYLKLNGKIYRYNNKVIHITGFGE